MSRKSTITITVQKGAHRMSGKRVVVGGRTEYTNREGVAEFEFDSEGGQLSVYADGKSFGEVRRGGDKTCRLD
jgi:hypothetical protein